MKLLKASATVFIGTVFFLFSSLVFARPTIEVSKDLSDKAMLEFSIRFHTGKITPSGGHQETCALERMTTPLKGANKIRSFLEDLNYIITTYKGEASFGEDGLFLLKLKDGNKSVTRNVTQNELNSDTTIQLVPR